MTVYADTSFLLSLYLPDIHTRQSVAALTSAPGPVLVTPLNEIEFANALQLRCFRRELTQKQARSVFSNLESDLAGGVYSLSPVPPEAFPAAMRLSRKHTSTLGARSLDILHVASALSVRADTFFTFDRVQNQLAALEGLRTL